MRFKIYNKDPDMVQDTETLNVYVLRHSAISSGPPDPDEVWLDLFGEIERLDEAIQKAQKIASEEGGLSKCLWQHLMGIELPSDEEKAVEKTPKGCRLAKSPCPVCRSKWIRTSGICPTCGMSIHGGEWPGERG